MIAIDVLISLLVAVALYFLGNQLLTTAGRGFERYKEIYVSAPANDLATMMLFLERDQIVALSVIAAFFGGWLGLVVFNIPIAIAMTIGGALLPMNAKRIIKRRRIKKFNEQLVDALQAMSGALKAGLSFQQAADYVAKEAQQPLSHEFSLFVREVKLGVPLEEGLRNMAARVGSEDLELVVTSTAISKQLGGNMAEMYETLATAMRERFRIEGRIDALTAQGKLQGIVISAMPLLVGLAYSYVRPDMFGPMMSHLFGIVLVLVIIIMEVLGYLVIQRIVNIDV